jgi:CDP-paratose 2-epimerase
MKAAVPVSGGRLSCNQGRPELGIVEWFRIGERDRSERALQCALELGFEHIRLGLSWADSVRPEGTAWFDWLIPAMARRLKVLPCIACTPASASADGRPCSPPGNLKAFGDFIDVVLSRYGDHFDALELWNKPLDLHWWDRRLDPDFEKFSTMIAMAAHWVRRCNKKTVLAGISPDSTGWLELLGRRGVLEQIDVVGIHGPGRQAEHSWRGWAEELEPIRAVLSQFGSKAELWITGAGYSTWRHGEPRQLRPFLDAAYAPVQRIYWYCLQDAVADDGGDLPELEDRHHGFGLYTASGRPKLLARALAANGIAGVENYLTLRSIAARPKLRRKATLITGGAGFIGTNLAMRLLRDGNPVIVYDSLARPGVELNAAYLRDEFGPLVDIRLADLRDRRELRSAVRDCASVFHFAAQVAVTTSLVEPVDDMSINIAGSVALLEELRNHNPGAPLVFTSTNKVYGHLNDVRLVRRGDRYEPANPDLRRNGISEARSIDFCSPYGCSKGAADQYVLDYTRTFGLPAAVFRMSCIYGPRQWGTEDQGWIAFFLRAAMADQPITIYGDGRQVRDALFVEDLVDAFLLARREIDRISGQAFNIGGGPGNTLSLLELLEMMERLECAPASIVWDEWRPADQKWYVSDTRAFQAATGWSSKINLSQGLQRLHTWLRSLEGPGAVAQPMVATT